MIHIVIDNAEVPAKVLGVYKDHTDAETLILSFPEEELDLIEVVTWDIVKNVELV